MGKTLVHEVGHYLGLQHLWNDAEDINDCETESCATYTDYCNGTSSLLPAPRSEPFIKDTIKQKCLLDGEGYPEYSLPDLCNATFLENTFKDYFCPSNNPQVDPSNYMQYTPDLCRIQFTPDQVSRMRLVLIYARPGIEKLRRERLWVWLCGCGVSLSFFHRSHSTLCRSHPTTRCRSFHSGSSNRNRCTLRHGRSYQPCCAIVEPRR